MRFKPSKSAGLALLIAACSAIAAHAQTNPIRINSGGYQYVDASGRTWLGDRYYSGGSTYRSSSAIYNTTLDPLYQSERWGNFQYNIPVAPGTYNVVLHFAEIVFYARNSRIFDVIVEGRDITDPNLDVFAQAGGRNVAMNRTTQVAVNDGAVTIQVRSIYENPKLSAIEVIPVSTSNTPVPTIAPTTAATSTPRPTLTPTRQPTVAPTWQPTVAPTMTPTRAPTAVATQTPTRVPTIAPTRTPTPRPTVQTAIPELATWESQMLQYGRTHCSALASSSRSFDQKLADTYYDAQWVFYQIADYTRDTSWNNCARNAEAVYRDGYVLPSNGGVPGYWIFSHGHAQDYLRTGDATSRNAAVLLARNAAFARDGTPLSETVSSRLSREVAYVIMSYLNAEHMGEPRRARLAQMVDQALGHLNEWFVTQRADFVKPFMVGLTAHALISFHESTGDSRVIPALTNALDRMWERLWVPAAQAFLYIDRNYAGEGAPEPAADLNPLIAPAYAWLYYQTGEVRFRDRADQIFAGGVRNAWLTGGKQFNQSYRWSFDYVKWRKMAPLR